MNKLAQIDEHDDYVVVTFNGMLDTINFEANGSFTLRDELDALVELSGGRTVILDFQDQWWNVCASIYGNFPMLHKKLDGRVLFCNIPDESLDDLQVTPVSAETRWNLTAEPVVLLVILELRDEHESGFRHETV